MRDHALQAAGAIAVLTALIHGVIGETKVFARAQIKPVSIALLLRLVWQCGTIAWVALGILLMAVSEFGTVPARHWIVAAALASFGGAAIGNAWATRGRHFGWLAMALVCGLSVVGY